jgi:hypothetical protein
LHALEFDVPSTQCRLVIGRQPDGLVVIVARAGLKEIPLTGSGVTCTSMKIGRGGWQRVSAAMTLEELANCFALDAQNLLPSQTASINNDAKLSAS